jgi:hypothetical protein
MTCVPIRALIDNTTAVTYINKMGGMKENLNELTREILVNCPRILPIIQKTRDTPVPKIKETPVIAETLPDSFQIIRQPFVNQGLSKPVVNIILHSWRDSTKKQH